MKFTTTSAMAFIALVSLSACQQGGGYQSNQNTYKGAAGGAILGGAVGAFASPKNRGEHALIGAGLGTLAGMGIGAYMDNQEAQMKQQLQGSGVDVQRSGDDIILNMPNSITFDFDSARVRSQFNGTLQNLAGVLNQYPETNIEVVGHTDSVGTDAYNLQLSKNRAQAVVTKLISYNVTPGRLFSIGRGESEPVANNGSEAGREQNRRVEVRISPAQ